MELLSLFKDYIYGLLLGGFLAYIAYQQLLTNQNKFKLDLYNKRFDIYTATLKYYQELVANELSSETHRKFIEAKEASKFLFSKDPSIYQLLDEFHEDSFIVIGHRESFEQLKHSPDIFAQSAKDSTAFIVKAGKIVNKFSSKLEPYLNM